VEVTLSATDYHSSLSVPGGYGGGSVSLPITPPKHSLITTVCFMNNGHETVLLDGTTEPRTVSRSYVEIGGRAVVGDIALTFVEPNPRTLLDRLGEVFDHASNLTDGLVPAWAIWIFALLTAFGVPISIIFAFHSAVHEDIDGAR
jgi:hypothetical protein